MLTQFKQERKKMLEDTEALHQSMEEFVANIEKENDELYHKLVDYIKVKESKLDEKIRLVEEQLETTMMTATTNLHMLDTQDDDKQTDEIYLNEKELENEKISKLYKQGFSPKQITKVLKIDQGEVELVINMLVKKQSYNK